jgi:hypothetical protein
MRQLLLVATIFLPRNMLAQKTSVPCKTTDTTYFDGTALATRESWYGRALRRMGEPRLCPSEGLSAYRFLWLRSFHRPIAVRVVKTDKGAQLWVRVLGGAGGYDPGKLVQARTFQVSPHQWDSISVLVLAAKIWNLPTAEPIRSDTVNGQVRYQVGADGAQWILESVDGPRYHVVDRWTPRPDYDRVYYDLCRYLLTLSAIRLTREEIY